MKKFAKFKLVIVLIAVALLASSCYGYWENRRNHRHNGNHGYQNEQYDGGHHHHHN